MHAVYLEPSWRPTSYVLYVPTPPSSPRNFMLHSSFLQAAAASCVPRALSPLVLTDVCRHLRSPAVQHVCTFKARLLHTMYAMSSNFGIGNVQIVNHVLRAIFMRIGGVKYCAGARRTEYLLLRLVVAAYMRQLQSA